LDGMRAPNTAVPSTTMSTTPPSAIAASTATSAASIPPGGTGLTEKRRSALRSRNEAMIVGSPEQAISSGTIAAMVGTYTSRTLRPPRSACGSLVPGIVPKMISSAIGSRIITNTPGSRRISLTCMPIRARKPFAVIRGLAACGAAETVIAVMSVLLAVLGEVDEGVVQAGLLDPQSAGHDLTARQQRGH